MDVFVTFIRSVGENIQFVDIIDLAVASVLFYGLILLLQRSLSQRALRSIVGVSSVFLGIYILARLTGLLLIELIVEILFFLLVVGAILVFQEDIRSIIDQLGGWNIFGRAGPKDTSTETIDRLTEAAGKLAEEHVGALIALKGRESWDRLIHGGIPLNGEVTQPLLFSLFNPGAPGHDGAVLLDGKQLLAFAAHLPLSTELSDSTEYGTRHAAGLGLSEKCDAFVIIVSEERGEISVAEGGEMRVVEAPAELKSRLERFWDDRYLVHRGRRSTGWNFEHLRAGLLSIVFAAAVWLLFVFDPQTRFRPIEAPIAFENVPNEWHIEDVSPERATAFLSGPARAFDRMNPDEVVVSIELQEPVEGRNEQVLTANDVQVPRGLQVDQIEPQEVEFTVQPMQSLRAAVRVQAEGQLQNPLELRRVRASPDSITVLVPEDYEDPPSAISTESIDLSEIEESTTLTRGLIVPENVRLSADVPSQVTIVVEVEEGS